MTLRWVKQSLFPVFWILGCSHLVAELQSHPPASQSHDGSAQPKRSRFVLTCPRLLTPASCQTYFYRVGGGFKSHELASAEWWNEMDWDSTCTQKWEAQKHKSNCDLTALFSPPHWLLQPAWNLIYHQTPPASITLANVWAILFRIVAEGKQVGDVLL